MNIPCHDCGCPHTTIKRHIKWSGLKFFLAERKCDNCGNEWMALEPLKNLDTETHKQGKHPREPMSTNYEPDNYMEHTTKEERDYDEETFKPSTVATTETHDLLFKLIGEIKDLKITITNTNKKVKELLTIIDKKVLKKDG